MNQLAAFNKKVAQDVHARILANRQDHSHLNSFEHIQAFFLAASQLKNDVVRGQVMYVLGAALDNADDSAHDSFGSYERAEYGNVRTFWRAMFYSSAQSMSTERHFVSNEADGRIHGAAARWLAARGLMG